MDRKVREQRWGPGSGPGGVWGSDLDHPLQHDDLCWLLVLTHSAGHSLSHTLLVTHSHSLRWSLILTHSAGHSFSLPGWLIHPMTHTLHMYLIPHHAYSPPPPPRVHHPPPHLTSFSRFVSPSPSMPSSDSSICHMLANTFSTRSGPMGVGARGGGGGGGAV